MEPRKKVAIYIDYTLRIPNFKASYDAFKSEIFSDKSYGIDVEDEIKGAGDTRMFWKKQMLDPSVERFYASRSPGEDDYVVRSSGMDSYFFNNDQYRKFIDDYSFNLYTDCVVPNSQDIDIINLAQVNLFDVFLIDEYQSKRKISNTLFFLAKSRIYPQGVVFLNEGNFINEESYFGVWNPKKNLDQVNAKGNKSFLNWFQELEKRSK